MVDLAIVIPAYKIDYLDKTLDSLSSQTNKDFTVYIGDDCSPYDLSDVVNRYSEQLNIVYRRFDTNLGKENLVHHWNRCLDMMQGETFFCLFSDDDVMEASCVERFQETLKQNGVCDVYHFNINIMDASGAIVTECTDFPDMLSADDFLRQLYSCQIDARMPEFVFRTQAFRKAGGFVDFDLAYRSDNATVLVTAKEKGICTIQGARVLWRDSGINVSSSRNKELRIRRMYANIDFFNWLEKFYAKKKEVCPLSPKMRLRLLLGDTLALADCVQLDELYAALRRMNQLKRNPWLYWRSRFHVLRKYKKRMNG